MTINVIVQGKKVTFGRFLVVDKPMLRYAVRNFSIVWIEV